MPAPNEDEPVGGRWWAFVGDIVTVTALLLIVGTAVLMLLGLGIQLLGCAMFYRGFLFPDDPPRDCAAAPQWAQAVWVVVATAAATVVVLLLRRLATRPRR